MNKCDSAFSLRWAKKIKGINLLGGKCEICGNNNAAVLDFHHAKSGKDFQIGRSMGLRWSILEKEMKRCELLCSNCHSELHYVNSRASKLKENFLEKYGKDIKCERCGYRGKNLRSLCFHHKNPKNKKFTVSWAFSRKINGCTVQDIVDEINKCIVICRNCHKIEHCDKNKIKKMTNDIEKKVKNHREQKKIDEKKVLDLKSEGKNISEIAKILNRNKSSIFYVFHRV